MAYCKTFLKDDRLRNLSCADALSRLGAEPKWLTQCDSYIQTLREDDWYIIEDYTTEGLYELDEKSKIRLGRIIDNAPRLSQALTVYRGFNQIRDQPYVHNYNKVGFLSTSLLPEVAAKFTYFNTPDESHTQRIVALTLPKNTPALWLDEYTDYHEQEVLIPDLKVEITNERLQRIKFRHIPSGNLRNQDFLVWDAHVNRQAQLATSELPILYHNL